MTDIIIPPEAVEAAALAIFRTRYSFDPVFPQDDHQWELSRAYATAALRAAINAWPGATVSKFEWGKAFAFLPLPTENTNAEG